MTAVEILQETKKLIADPAHWTQHCWARNAAGVSVTINDPDAVCYCLTGALAKVGLTEPDHTGAYGEAYSKLLDAAKLLNYKGSMRLNDRGTHKEVLWAIDKAIDLIRGIPEASPGV